jgi:hypothetical protein
MNHSDGTLSRLRAALLAALVAVMIWVFAEGESVTSRNVVASVSFPLEPAGAGGDVVVRPDPKLKGIVRVRLEGTTRTIELAAAAVSGEIRLTPGQPGVPDLPGAQSVDLQEAISALLKLKGLGSTLAEVEPKSMIVEIVRLVSREIPIRAQLTGGATLAIEPTCTPATVTIRIPAQDSPRVPEGATAIAFVSEQELRRMRPGSVGGAAGAQTVLGFVRPPDEAEGIEPMLISPEQVTVTLRLKPRVETLKIPSVPVWIGLPATEDSGKWSVDVQDKAITDVVLLGPAAELERIRSGQVSVRAVVDLTREDLEKGISSKPATFPGLPPGVTASAESQIVRLHGIARREPPAATPAKP